jgi:signal transduction histidine kinase
VVAEKMERGERVFSFENRYVAKDGRKLWLEWYASPFTESDQTLAIAREITTRKEAQEALLRSEKLAATGRLAATIAHEVNNPLAAAMNAVYLVAGDPTLRPETKNLLTAADQELRRAAHITQQTLGFYRESSGQQQVAVPLIVEQVLSAYAGKLQNRKISVQCRYRCSISSRTDKCPENCEQCNGCLVVHAGELRQIISNLLANGIDALSDGGVMSIRVSRLSTRIQLTIADNGHGIRAEHLKRVFEPFFTTKETIGTGLGLWITQELVRKHDGVIKVRSRRDKGTVFRLTFPQRPADGFDDIGIAPHARLGKPA